MITFLICLFLLVVAYFTYGKYIEKVFKVDYTRATPSKTQFDGVDYVPMPLWKTFFIQLLNIAGLGPIFGAILGATYGPVAFLWITIGGIFMGAVQDYASGMISVFNKGMSFPEIVGKYMGITTQQIMRVFTVFFMILVGTIFMTGPAGILEELTSYDKTIWLWIIVAYYLLASILPIDKLIGKIYPAFSVILLFMALSMLVVVLVGDFNMVELNGDTFKNMHDTPDKFPIFPTLFITIACGALSGFHATQSPMMARCLNNEKEGRPIFFGAMIAESIIALIWAGIAMCFYGGVEQLNEVVVQTKGDAGVIVAQITRSTLGQIGSAIAILGVVIASITSGDSSFRAARMMVADFMKIEQKQILRRIYICLPIFAIAIVIAHVNFDVIWRYFAWGNQVLATIALWSVTYYLVYTRNKYILSLVPALFITYIVCTYIFSDYGFGLGHTGSSLASGAISLIALAAFFLQKKRIERSLAK